ncbi:MAG: hypothetical protein FJ318_06135 [SAR202 cluster bacterium]|nr:hypothetical protein [SAR202 cluster bacterium]
MAGVRASSYPLLVEALPVLYAAEARHGLPRGLLAAIAVWESSGGRHACGANWWGYASCGVEFASIEGGAEIVARTLAGYGVDTWTALCWYNAGPSGCRAGLGHAYADRVLATMEGFR